MKSITSGQDHDDNDEDSAEDAGTPMKPITSGQDRDDNDEDSEHESLMVRETVIDEPNDEITKKEKIKTINQSLFDEYNKGAENAKSKLEELVIRSRRDEGTTQ